MVKKREDFSGKKVTVLGLGLHGGGVSSVRFFVERGARVTVTDLKDETQLAPSLDRLASYRDIRYVLGKHRKEDFSGADMVVASPAIPWNNPYIRAALDAGVRVEMDSSIFFRECPCPIVGVTGTKGKTTTALLASHLLKASGEDVFDVGVGQIPVLKELSKIEKNSAVVFELSSWRLGALGKADVCKSPHIAVFVNFFADHLNYYPTMAAYLEDKKNIFRWQEPEDWCVLNRDDALVRNLEREVPSQVVSFGFSRPSESPAVFARGGEIFLDDGNDTKRLVATRELDLKGKHNIANAMAAIAAVWAYGISVEKLKKHLPGVDGVPHRLEFAGRVRGVGYYNDTTATIPEAVVSALHSFTQPVILIAGGSDKGLSYEAFAKSVSHRTKEIVFLDGTATPKMRAALGEIIGHDRAASFPEVSSMDKAVERAAASAESGDIVLLSPGAASFGMFVNEFDRGDQFRRSVKNLRGK